MFNSYIFCLQAVCPVCRERLPEEIVSSVDAHDLRDSIDRDEEHVKYVPSAEVIEVQQKMAELYKQQLEKGGIIDLEAERNKYLIPKVTVVTHCCLHDAVHCRSRFFLNFTFKKVGHLFSKCYCVCEVER